MVVLVYEGRIEKRKPQATKKEIDHLIKGHSRYYEMKCLFLYKLKLDFHGTIAIV